MNWLAHIVVSSNSIDYQLGNLLADPMKGRPWPTASADTRAGFAMHKAIDRFSDDNAVFRQSKSRLGDSGHLRSVVVDLVYDYLLTQGWMEHCRVDQASFIRQFSWGALTSALEYPQQPRQIVERIVRSGYLSSYTTLAGFRRALQRVDQRLSPRIRARETTAAYLPIIKAELPALERDFQRFFPQLVRYFKSQNPLDPPPWLR